MNLHYLPATVTGILGDGADLGVRVRYSWEQPLVLGSAGGPRRARDIVGAATCFIVNGDTLADVDLTTLAAAHASSGALVTMALAPSLDPLRYGGVAIDDEARVTGFVSRGPGAGGARHFVGVQVVDMAAFDGAAADRPSNSVGDVYNRLIERRPGCIRGLVADTAFWDIGTPADYVAAARAFDPGGRGAVGHSVRIDPTAQVTRSILWDDIEVGPGAVIDECIVTDGVRIPAAARHCRAMLLTGSTGGVVSTPIAYNHA